MRGLHSLAAPRTPAYLTVWWQRRGDARGETTQQRQRIHLHRDGPVGEGLLEEDADQALLALLDPVLPNGRAQHVAQQRLAAAGGERACARGRIHPADDFHRLRAQGIRAAWTCARRADLWSIEAFLWLPSVDHEPPSQPHLRMGIEASICAAHAGAVWLSRHRTRDVIPYLGLRAGPAIVDLPEREARFALGGTLEAGVVLWRRPIVSGRYDALTRVAGFDLSSFSARIALRLF
jgi:hypothetical protein